jgi:RNA polymerase sigma factor (sigma-70 family)
MQVCNKSEVAITKLSVHFEKNVLSPLRFVNKTLTSWLTLPAKLHLQPETMSIHTKNWGFSEADFNVLQAELVRGGESRFQQVFTQNYQRYTNYIRSEMNLSYDDASDVTVEAFVKIHRFLKEGRVAYGNLDAYSMQVIRNEYLMLLRKRKQLPESDVEVSNLELLDEEYDESTLQQFEQAFSRLGEDCRNLLQQHYFQKKAHRDIGVALNISEDASKTRTKVCRNKLRDIFQSLLNAA